MNKCNGCENIVLITPHYPEKYGVPESKFCSECREKRRLLWRNEWSLYKRKSDLSGEDIISYICPSTNQKVYSLNEWFSNDWDAVDFGREYDFEKSFFKQFKDLLSETPHIPLLVGGCENSEYTNYSLENKNCYMVAAADYNEDCFYSGYIFKSRDCMDCLFVTSCELCYECIDCESCYQLKYSNNCTNCQVGDYLIDCIGCQDCIGCIGLQNQKYCIFNKQYSKQDYETYKKRIKGTKEQFLDYYEEFKNSFDSNKNYIKNSENCTGTKLINCKDCTDCHDLIDSRDCKNVRYGINSKDCAEINGAPNCELNYECVASPNTYNCKFCSSCWENSSSLTYCHLCRASKDCFGCVALYQKQYCIFNMQYTKEEYEELLPRIIDHVKASNEYGEFFPSWVSPFAYNETTAQDYYPLTKKEAYSKGLSWVDEVEQKPKIQDAATLRCQETGHLFRLIEAEKKFLLKLDLELPKVSPKQRHLKRLRQRG